MFKKGFLVGFVLFCFLLTKLSADLIAIYACDTLGDGIEVSVTKDLRNVRSLARQIASNTRLHLTELLYNGENCVPSDILDDLRGLSVTSEDMVFFYFSGHGDHRESKDSPWPDLHFTITDEGVDYNHICEILSAKNPRFLLAIADCCNTLVDDAFAAPIVEEFQWKKSPLKKNYKTLFLDQTGVIQVTSSIVGESSWALRKGAVFTLEFIASLKTELGKKRNVSWESLLNRAKRQSLDFDQTAYWVIE